MLVRRAPRGGVLGFKVVGFDSGPIVEPHMKNWAKPLFLVFVVAAFAAIDLNRELTFVVFPIPIPLRMRARTLLILVGGGTLLFLLLGAGGNIAHAAHLAGGLLGYLYGRRVRTPFLGVPHADSAAPRKRRWWSPGRRSEPPGRAASLV